MLLSTYKCYALNVRCVILSYIYYHTTSIVLGVHCVSYYYYGHGATRGELLACAFGFWCIMGTGQDRLRFSNYVRRFWLVFYGPKNSVSSDYHGTWYSKQYMAVSCVTYSYYLVIVVLPGRQHRSSSSPPIARAGSSKAPHSTSYRQNNVKGACIPPLLVMTALTRHVFVVRVLCPAVRVVVLLFGYVLVW